MDRLELGMPAAEVDLVVIASRIEEFGESQGWDGVLVMRVNLVLEELALNVRDYGVVDGRRVDILIDSSPSSVMIDSDDRFLG